MDGSIHGNRETAASQDEKGSVTDLGAAVSVIVLPLFLQVGYAYWSWSWWDQEAEYVNVT